MIRKEGTHGTTKTRVNDIISQGFKDGRGRGGSGVYFWHNNKYGIELAKGWYQRQLLARKYFYDKDNQCVVIVAELKTEDNEYLDLAQPLLQDRMADILSKKEFDMNDNKVIAGFYDAFIAQIEKESGKIFKILAVRVPPPSEEYCSYPIKALGAPTTYVVRDNSCINILNCIDC